MDKLDADALGPLLDAAAQQPDPNLRIAALEAASHFPLSTDAWQVVASRAYRVVREEVPGSEARRAALQLTVQVPLLSLRGHLRALAEDPAEADREVIAKALDDVGDPSRLDTALAAARTGDPGAFGLLASLPLEDLDLRPTQIPPLPPESPADTRVWRALALARIDDYGALDAILEGGTPRPELFRGDPWVAYTEIAAIRPIPDSLRAHLLTALRDCDGCPNERLIQLLAWAATGIADAEGRLVHERGRDSRETLPGTDPPVRGPRVEIAPDGVQPERDLASRITATVSVANRRAAGRPPRAWAEAEAGNRVIESLPASVPAGTWPVAGLALQQLQAERPILDDEQMAWILARDDPARVVREISRLLAQLENDAQRRRLLRLLRLVADQVSGRAGSPLRGDGGPGFDAPVRGAEGPALDFSLRGARGPGIGTPVGRGPLIDDEPWAAATSPEPPPSRDRVAGSEMVPEERRVQARVLHKGQTRNTFVAGSDNLIRCWIGLPEHDAAVADQPIPRADIPPQGLLLTAVLSWGDQTDSKPLLLPAARDARSGDCDLRIRVPDGERYVSAEIAFLYRGRAFEVVQVEAFALAPGEAEGPGQGLRIRVQVSRRAVIDLPERTPYNATILWGTDEADGEQGPNTSLRVFGDQGAGRYDLRKTENAIAWINNNLFITEKILVRRRVAQGADDGRPMLDADDPEVRRLLRDMARHGAVLFNELSDQGFVDPGPRIQLLNRDARAYVPLEFVYDQGYPADDAGLCDGWEAALTSDSHQCPVCSAAPLTPEQRHWAPTICPLGFWSLQKIIERLDPSPDGRIAAPSVERRTLPAITKGLFASSDRVPPEGRAAVWQTLTWGLDEPEMVEDWAQWREALLRHPQLLLVLPHHGLEAALDYLEIGNEQLPPQLCRLSRGQLTERYVNPDRVDPGPIVLLLGCRTDARTEDGYTSLARRFQQLPISIVVGTLAQILGRNAAPVASELVSQLLAVDDPEADFGAIMRRVRRRMLANGYLLALCLIALGDAEWRLTPRQGPPVVAGDQAHVSP